MPNQNNFNLNFTPKSYWESKDVLSAILANVKGQERRKMIKHFYENGILSKIDDSLLEDSMSLEQIESIGKIDLSFWGGEYLPAYKLDEVEIARVYFDSTLQDVISIRARKTNSEIIYSVVGEYDVVYDFSPKESTKPLSMQEIINMIDDCGIKGDPCYSNLVLMYVEDNYNIGGDLDLGCRDFVHVDSCFYPELGKWYKEVLEEWCNETEKENATY